MKLRVECRAGHRGEAEPVAIDFGARRVKVCSIDDRWLATSHRYFRVTGSDGDTYILRHDSESGDWTLGAYRSRSAE